MWVIDTDSILKLYTTYSPDYFSTLWAELDELAERSQLLSTIVNYLEIEERIGQEWLYEWKKAHKAMFLEIDGEVQDHVVEILEVFPDLIEQQSDKEQADPYLIALAMQRGAIVITEEIPLTPEAMRNPERKSKMKIPNACAHFGIQTMNLVRFVNSPEWRKA
jgi:hypothetical protein